MTGSRRGRQTGRGDKSASRKEIWREVVDGKRYPGLI